MATKTKTKKKTTAPPINLDDLAIIGGQNAVTYGPQINQIRDLNRQTDEQYKSDIEAAKSNSSSAQMYAKRAIPTLKDIYHDAAGENSRAHKLVTAVIGPQGNDPFSRALASEAEGQRNRTTSGKAGSLSEMQDRITGAESGKQFAITQAKRERSKTKGLLSQKLADILQEQGAVTAAGLTTLRTNRDALTQKAQTEADKEQAKTDAATKKENAKKREQAAKHKGEVRTATGDLKKRIEDAIGSWAQFATNAAPRTEIKEVDGKQVETIVLDPKTHKPVMDPATPSEIKSMMIDAGYTPGEIHIALLRRVGKPLDSQALTYIKAMKAKGVRIPREWLTDRRVASVPGLGDAAG